MQESWSPGRLSVQAVRPNLEPASGLASSILAFHFWFHSSVLIQLSDSVQKLTAIFSLSLPYLHRLDLFPSKTRCKPISLQLFSVDPNNLGAVAKRISSLICCHAEQLAKFFIKVHLCLRHINICSQDSVSLLSSLICWVVFFIC